MQERNIHSVFFSHTYRYAVFILLVLLSPIGNVWAQAEILPKINAFRAQAGLPLLKLSKELSVGCQQHAEYLIKNSVYPGVASVPHDENPDMPGYSLAGKKCGENATIISVISPELVIDYWMATLFHRVPFLNPQLEEVGFGHAVGGKWRNATVVDVFSNSSGKRTGQPSAYPADGQLDVPLTFGLARPGFIVKEHPSPIAQDKDGIAGYPITLSFYENEKIELVSAVLKKGKQKIATWVSTPQKPAHKSEPGYDVQQNTICLIPKDALQKQTTYLVNLKIRVNQKIETFKWSFTTRATL